MIDSLDHLLTLEAQLIRRENADPLEPDGELVDVVAGTVRCELQQTVDRDEHDGRVQVTGWRAFLPADVDLSGWDAIELADGERLELEGDPWPVRHPRTGAIHHVEATLRRTR